MKNFYRQLLKKSYLILKRYKFLWFFGIFAAIMGNGREIQMLSRASEIVPNLPTRVSEWGVFFSANTPVDLIKLFWEFITLKPSVAIPFVIVLLLVLVFVIWLMMVSQIALVSATDKINASKAVDFSTVFAATHGKVWEVFGLNIFTRLILYTAFILLLLPFSGLLMISNGNMIAIFSITLLAFLVFVPLAIIMNFVLKYGIIYAVIDDEKLWPAFINAWKLFWKEWLVSIEFALIMFVLNILVVIGLFVVLFFLAVPFLALGVMLLTTKLVVLANLAIIVAMILFLGLIVLVSAGFAVFQYSGWTLLFFELKKGKAYPKLLRMISHS